MVERLHMDSQAAKHVQAYLEYEQIVGVDDGGQPMSDAEFEQYKAKVRAKRANRLYVNWRNMQTGRDCKAIGPASQCFCGHRFKEHNFDNVHNKKVDCKDKVCKCKLFDYIPVFGSQDFKCMGCRHSCHEHNEVTKKCRKPGCKCACFSSTHSCSCGMGYDVHATVFETRAEREAEGRQVDSAMLQASNMSAGMGGLGHQDFGSLADDQDRRDMMNPAAIVSNMANGRQIMGEGMQRQAIEQGLEPEAINRGRRAIGGVQGTGRGAGRGAAQYQQDDDQALVPASGGGMPSMLDLFNTPHSFAGGSGGGAARTRGVGGITKQMGRLKM